MLTGATGVVLALTHGTKLACSLTIQGVYRSRKSRKSRKSHVFMEVVTEVTKSHVIEVVVTKI